MEAGEGGGGGGFCASSILRPPHFFSRSPAARRTAPQPSDVTENKKNRHATHALKLNINGIIGY